MQNYLNIIRNKLLFSFLYLFLLLYLNLFYLSFISCQIKHFSVRYDSKYSWGIYNFIYRTRYASKMTAIQWFTVLGLTQSMYNYW